ncbi:MAG: TlpA family protein disulfide reductase [Gemmatimonadetes bacterium]|nr:TlpA family protein disulfide reductase [Gemmatimonadota bacterium]MYG21997.1 TlpA family protein disulfide reductase [Gemmatimonadota bacterium]MYJ37374.1 TlpA family protein disulfide reductase [Gemmatimonadota bacterium]
MASGRRRGALPVGEEPLQLHAAQSAHRSGQPIRRRVRHGIRVWPDAGPARHARVSLRSKPVTARLASRTALAAILVAPGYAPAAAQRATVDNLPAENGLAIHGHADYDWTIRPLDGEPVELAAFRGSVLFINLWASWCTPCIREMETIERLGERLSDTDVSFLIVAAEGERAVRRHLRLHSHDLPIYLEIDPMPAAFALRGLPTSWIVDREGQILVLRHGEAVWDTDEVERFMRSLLSTADEAGAEAATPGASPARPTPAPRVPATSRTSPPAPPG